MFQRASETGVEGLIGRSDWDNVVKSALERVDWKLEA